MFKIDPLQQIKAFFTLPAVVQAGFIFNADKIMRVRALENIFRARCYFNQLAESRDYF